MQKKYYVYILSNHTHTTLYIGITNDIHRRIFEHKNHVARNSFTKKYTIYKLLWFQEFREVEEAIMWEKRIKSWRREKKFKLIRDKNPLFRNLMQ